MTLKTSTPPLPMPRAGAVELRGARLVRVLQTCWGSESGRIQRSPLNHQI